MNTQPSTTPVPEDQAQSVAQERLARTGWALPSSATDVAVTLVDDKDFRYALDVAVIEFQALRTEVLDMAKTGEGSRLDYPGDQLQWNDKEILEQTRLPENFRFIKSITQVAPGEINLLIIPDEGDAPRFIVLSYTSTD